MQCAFPTSLEIPAASVGAEHLSLKRKVGVPSPLGIGRRTRPPFKGQQILPKVRPNRFAERVFIVTRDFTGRQVLEFTLNDILVVVMRSNATVAVETSNLIRMRRASRGIQAVNPPVGCGPIGAANFKQRVGLVVPFELEIADDGAATQHQVARQRGVPAFPVHLAGALPLTGQVVESAITVLIALIGVVIEKLVRLFEAPVSVSKAYPEIVLSKNRALPFRSDRRKAAVIG